MVKILRFSGLVYNLANCDCIKLEGKDIHLHFGAVKHVITPECNDINKLFQDILEFLASNRTFHNVSQG